MLNIRSSGSFHNTIGFLKKAKVARIFKDLNYYGKTGVEALSLATPVDSGETASSWEYRIVRRGKRWTVEWFNTNVVDGVNVAVILQYGHGTGTGGYVEGIDYINPAMAPIFDALSNNVWKKVTSA